MVGVEGSSTEDKEDIGGEGGASEEEEDTLNDVGRGFEAPLIWAALFSLHNVSVQS
jgi:hypothetical protein